ncbi:MAG: hypothetical protein QHG99_00145 [Methanomicrobiales archaeon]|nr:hypothetical protein [Methanomicrobiales archaeon]
MATVSRHSGRSMGEAVVIRDVDKQMEGIAAEYRYIAERFGEQGKDWRLAKCMHEEHDERHYDILTIELAGGKREVVYFDVTFFYDSE